MIRWARQVLAAASVCLVALPMTSSAQVAIGVSGVAGNSSTRMFHKPRGGTVFLTIRPQQRFSARAEFTAGRSDERHDVIRCVAVTNFSTWPECQGQTPAVMNYRTSFHAVTAMALVSVVRTPRIRLQGGAGLSVMSLGQKTLFEPLPGRETAQQRFTSAGRTLAALASFKPVQSAPMWVQLDLRHYSGNRSGCVYASLCDGVSIIEKRVGISYEFTGSRR